MEPVIEASTKVSKPSRMAIMAMINSAALPSVALMKKLAEDCQDGENQ
jgi:hypothetical protein